ncbi:hypothetical protein [Bacillus cereus group sp. BfR-BA-01360]|uniref:hypothetical protein n=1 Tax=Bacillus cereus group sp. BfR-BA-01360 TaxID=2920321 RepID=UPI001F5741AA|nr:hypothetical protein [Bacillus cereus group sp. BfR-BA-01360]
MEKWPEERIEAYKRYAEQSIKNIDDYERKASYHKREHQMYLKLVADQEGSLSKELGRLKEQGWELRGGEWVQTE